MIKLEYFRRVRKRSFWIVTLLAPIGLVALIAIPILILIFSGGEHQVVVLDQSGDPGLYQLFEKKMLKDQSPGTKYILTARNLSADADPEEEKRQIERELKNDRNAAFIYLHKGTLDGVPPEYYATQVADNSLEVLGRNLRSAITERRLVTAGLDQAKVESINAQPEMQTIKVGPTGNTVETGQSFIVPLLLLLMLYMTILGYSQSVARGAREEKDSRMIEVLITTVEPYQIMVSKLIGIGLVGLTQYAIWAALVIPLKALVTGNGINLPRFPYSLFAYCVLFFILGYFLFGTLNLMVGAIASKEEDAALISRPLGLINFLPLLIYLVVVKDPHSGLSVVLSMLPFLSPTMMLTRIAVSPTPWWHILLSVLIMIASILFALWIASKAYRANVLIYGKRITISEIFRWMRYS